MLGLVGQPLQEVVGAQGGQPLRQRRLLDGAGRWGQSEDDNNSDDEREAAHGNLPRSQDAPTRIRFSNSRLQRAETSRGVDQRLAR